MTNIIFPTDTPNITPTLLDRVLLSDESNGGELGDATIEEILALGGDSPLIQLSSTNLNTIVTLGRYCASTTCTNLPESGVKTRLLVNVDPTNSDLVMQEALTTTTKVSYVRTTANGGTTWSSWDRIKATDETKQPLDSVLTNTTASFTTALKSTYDGYATSKENTIASGTTGQYRRGDKSWQTLDKSAVGLSNVDNTSDSTKNSATATLTNKSISLGSNTVTMTAAQLQTAVTDNDVAFINGGNNFSGTQTFSSSPRLGSDDLPFYTSTGNAGYIRGGNAGYIVIQGNPSGSGDKNVYIETPGDLIVNSKNRTSGGVSWTPTRTLGITVTSITINSASYKIIGKTMFVSAWLTILPSSTGAFIGLTTPATGSGLSSLSGRTGDSSPIQNYADATAIIVGTSFVSGVSKTIMFSGYQNLA